mgnify:FL=1
MNNSLTEKHKQDFNSALNIYSNPQTHESLINLLQIGSIAEKQAAAISLEMINNKKEAKILMSNLTNCDGKIREAASFRLREFVPQNPEFYTDFAQIFLDAIIDINGNICRNTIDAIRTLKTSKEFVQEFCEELVTRTVAIIPPIKAFDIQEGKYKINKEVFKLYWYLETISEFSEFIRHEDLLKILSDTKEIGDYTIREKTAKILSKLESYNEFDSLRQELKQDQNYYVRRV